MLKVKLNECNHWKSMALFLISFGEKHNFFDSTTGKPTLKGQRHEQNFKKRCLVRKNGKNGVKGKLNIAKKALLQKKP